MRAVEFLTEKPVQSTWIVNIMHNRPNKVVTMRLSNGRSFSIQGIPRSVFDRWIKSESKGHFFHQFVKDKHTIKRIK